VGATALVSLNRSAEHEDESGIDVVDALPVIGRTSSPAMLIS